MLPNYDPFRKPEAYLVGFFHLPRKSSFCQNGPSKNELYPSVNSM